uniref:Uncharacterized protein n=1 Tax=Rhizophora mucronata TaxID=61149 RepID=A0A2P2QDG1_RHIMU
MPYPIVQNSMNWDVGAKSKFGSKLFDDNSPVSILFKKVICLTSMLFPTIKSL